MIDRSVLFRSLLAGSLAVTALPVSAAVRKPVRKPAVRVPARTAAKAPAKPAALPAELKDARLELMPLSAVLDGPRSSQHLIVQAVAKDGATYDVTDRAVITPSKPGIVKLDRDRALPLGDGEASLVAKVGALSSQPVVVTVKNAKAPAGIEFTNDIMPILAKTGCNSTACHGSPVGKGGFKLSLFGYEPELDQVAIIKDAGGKRIDVKHPEKSLFLTKPTMGVAHAGGMRFKTGSPEYQTILQWLKDGAPGIGEFEARVRQVMVMPEQPWLPKPDAKHRLAVTAVMSDGSTRDVTDKVLFTSNDDAIAEVSDDGMVTAKRAGETAVMIRYMGQVGVSRVAVLQNWKVDPYPQLQKNNYIDQLVQAKLQKLRMVPSDLCTDEEFIRRASVDACGIIPTPQEVRDFVADRRPDKRAKLVDKLLERPEFVDLWTMKWNDILRNNPRLSRVGLGAYAKWIREQVASNRPYDQFVHELLTATGKNTSVIAEESDLPPNAQGRPGIKQLLDNLNRQPANPAANYFVISKDPLDTTSATSQIFLGVRIECARCHNHPFEKWTQNDYYGLAAFMGGIQTRGNNQTPQVVSFNPRAQGIRNPKTNEVVDPRTLDNAEIKVERGQDRRVALADWITSAKNPWFAKALVNRLWGHYFGRGIVEPIDDFRVTNPPSNPELLDALAADFAEHKFDVKSIHRVIMNSRTYQQSSKPNGYNEADTSNFARYYPKRMMAEALYDSISQATGVYLNGPQGGPFAGARAALRQRTQQMGMGGRLGKYLQGAIPEGEITRIMQIPVSGPGMAGAMGGRGFGQPAQFLNTFGKPRREVVCECERSNDGNIGQALALINGGEVNQKIQVPFGRTQQLIRANMPDPAVVEELYLATLSRKPDEGEMHDALTLIHSAKARGEGIEDLMWGLINSREFLFVH